MKLAILSAGAPRHGRNLTTQWQAISDAHGWGWELTFLEWVNNRGYEDYDLQQYEWIVNVGNFENVFAWFAQFDRPKKVALWVGTDILQHQSLCERGYPDDFTSATLHVADAPNLVSEAQALTGLHVGYLRSIPPMPYDRAPISQWNHVLGYVPTGREDFFRYPWFIELARDYPDVTFHILGRPDTPNETGLANVVHEKEVSGEDKRKLFESTFAYCRPVEHDGIGLTLIELGQMGRHIFHSDTRIPYVKPARTLGEMEYWLDTCLNERVSPNQNVSDYYHDNFGTAALARDLQALRDRMSRV